MTMLVERPVDEAVETAPAEHPPRGLLSRIVRGRPDDPAWVRPSLLLLLLSTAVAYTWALGDSGWGNSFYAAAVQAGTKSWKAFFFGSSDASNFITVDKPPASLWVMEISARIFGLSSWSILVPQALEGVATVALLYATVRRWFRPSAALLAGAVAASTPVAVLMFRYNNPDALLVLLLTLAAYATVRALEKAGTMWLVLAMSAVGLGFTTKMLQAFLVVPAIAAVYLITAPTSLGRRIRQVLVAGVALVVSAGWWVAAVELIPAADRPYIGGSQNNSLLNLIFGYNGLGRLSGNESGSVGGGAVAGSRWGPTGLIRLFQTDMGGQISWLIPAALIFLVAILALTWRSARTDRTRAAVLLWGGWLLVTGLVFSYAQGIIHPYYNVALAPAVGALVGIGTVTLWHHHRRRSARAVLAVALAATVVWSFVLLSRSPTWFPWLRPAVVVVGLAAAAVLAVAPSIRTKLAAILGVAGLSAALAGPAAYALDTVTTPHSGAIPSAGPAVQSATPGGPGGFGGGLSFGRGFRGFTPGRLRSHGPGSFVAPGRPPGSFGGFPGGTGGLVPLGGGLPGGFGGLRPSGAPTIGGASGFLNASTPGKALVTLLERRAGSYRWVAATVNSNSAAGYQLATDDPVMAIGGFNGTDPAPTLAQFESDVRHGDVHYFIASGGFGGGGFGRGGAGGGGATSTASQITTWVESHYTSTTVDGVTIYDLSEATHTN
ncbi:MAG TPA: glycosyltransferase family 39 protein [Acidimicrobiales bacterium]|nr:glycosyltransferase family 39 protein [Acidimicrobiales bacterium]